MTIRDFLLACDSEYRRLICPNNTSLCQNCFNDEFYARNENTYSCAKGCFYYAMHYGPAYISEIYHLLEVIGAVEEHADNLNVISLGGGIGTDYIAIRKYQHDKRLTIPFCYTLVDNSAQWQDVVNLYNNRIRIISIDLSQQWISLEQYNIVFLNKLISTLKANNTHNDFFCLFRNSLNTIRTGTYLIFNEINHYRTGRNDIIDFMRVHTNFRSVGPFFFRVNGAYDCDGQYIALQNTDLVFNNILDLHLSCEIMDSVRKTVFLCYKKVS